MEELISFIIPTYKRVQILEKKIYSVLNQSDSNIKLLIVDDKDSIYRKDTIKLVLEFIISHR